MRYIRNTGAREIAVEGLVLKPGEVAGIQNDYQASAALLHDSIEEIDKVGYEERQRQQREKFVPVPKRKKTEEKLEEPLETEEKE